MSLATLSIDIVAQMSGLRQDLTQVGQQVEGLNSKFSSLGAGIAGGAAVSALGAIAVQAIRVADSYTQIESKLRIVTGTTERAKEAQEQLFAIAQRTRQSLEGVADVYSTIARSASQLGLSQQTLLGVTETINQAVAISGGPAGATQAALFQLSQGLSTGALRGEELNSVLEQTPRLASAIAQGLGVTTGELRKLGEEGRLTSQAVIGALQASAGSVRAEFEQLTPTIGGAFTQLANSLGRVVDKINDATGATSALATIISGLSKGIDAVVDASNVSVRRSASNAEQLIQTRLSALSENDPRRPELLRQLDELRRRTDELGISRAAQGRRAVREMDNAFDAGQVAALEQANRKWGELNSKFDGGRSKQAALRAEIEATGKAAGKSEQEIRALIQAATTSSSSQRARVSRARQEPQQDEAQIELQRQAQSALNQTDVAQTAQREALLAYLRQLAVLYPANSEGARMFAQAIANVSGETARTAEETRKLNAQNEELDRLRQRYLSLIDPTREYARQLEEIRRLQASGMLSASEALEAEFQVQSGLQDTLDGLNQVRTAGTNVFTDLQRAVEGWGQSSAAALAQFATTGRMSFSSLANSIISDLLRMYFYQQLIRPIFNQISNATSGSSSGSLLGNFLTAIGSAFSGTAPGRASGGMVRGGSAYLVGERRPELFVPQTDGKILSSATMGQTTYNITVGSGVSPQEVAQAVEIAIRRAKADVANDFMRRGKISRVATEARL